MTSMNQKQFEDKNSMNSANEYQIDATAIS